MRRSVSVPSSAWPVCLLALVAGLAASDAIALAPSSRIESNVSGARLGESMANAGDVNGDGLDDLIVGALYYTNGQVNEGAAFLFLGRPGGFPATMTIADADAVIQSNKENARMGTAVASIGDVNGDGYGDVGIGAPGWDDPTESEGAVFVVLGGPNGLPSGGPEVASAKIQGDAFDARMGTTIGKADVNGDGYDDVVAGGRLFEDQPEIRTDEGYAFVFLGGPNGIASGGYADADTVIQSNACDANLGNGADGVGDVNGDGYDDIVLGAPRWTGGWLNCNDPVPPTGVHEGAALVYLGGPNGIPDGDWTTADAIIEGQQTDGRFGREVRGIGDANGDGYADVAIGATQYEDGQSNEGVVFLFYGSASGITATGPADADAELQGDQADTGDLTREEFGYAIDVGDYDDDGHPDLIVSAPYYDSGQTDEGAAFLFHGTANGIPSGSASTARRLESNISSAWMGSSVALADVDGDGKSDAFVGGNRMGYPLSGPDPQGSEGMVLGFALETACNDGQDDDGDGAIDLADVGCANADDRNEEVDYATGNPLGATYTVTTAVADTLLAHDLSNGAPITVILGSGGSVSRDLVAIEHSVVQLNGGAVAGDVVVRDAATAEILAGSIGGTVVASGSGSVAIHGGVVSALEARDLATIQVFGYGFSLPAGPIAATSGTITGTLEKGTPLDASFVRDAGAAIELVDVPEPAAAALALAAIAALGGLRRRTESRAR